MEKEHILKTILILMEKFNISIEEIVEGNVYKKSTPLIQGNINTKPIVTNFNSQSEVLDYDDSDSYELDDF